MSGSAQGEPPRERGCAGALGHCGLGDGHQPHPQGTPGCSGAHREDAAGWVGSSVLRPCVCWRVFGFRRLYPGRGQVLVLARGGAVGGFCLSVLCFVCPASPAAAPALECWCWDSSPGWAVFVSRPCSALSVVPGMSQIPRTHRSLWFNIHLKEGDVRSCWEIALSRSSRSCCRLFLASDAALGSSPRPSASARTL